MTEKKYIDILIKNDDIALDPDGLPVMISDLDSIVQDIKHAIRESGYLVLMIAERSSEKQLILQQKIVIVVEEDERIIPGTVVMYKDVNGNWIIEGETYEYGNVTLTVW